MSKQHYQSQGGNVYIRDTNNTLQTISTGTTGNYQRDWMSANSAATITTYGILVGTDLTAVVCSDYKMQTLIANGSGAGQLNHSATATIGATNAGMTCSLSITRAFSNASGGDITIQEIGLVVSCTTSSWYKFLVIHDNATQLIHNGETYLVIYTMQTSISS